MPDFVKSVAEHKAYLAGKQAACLANGGHEGLELERCTLCGARISATPPPPVDEAMLARLRGRFERGRNE